MAKKIEMFVIAATKCDIALSKSMVALRKISRSLTVHKHKLSKVLMYVLFTPIVYPRMFQYP